MVAASSAAAVLASKTSSLIHRRLYRSLLRVAQPFTQGKKAVAYTCLLHRTHFDLEDETFEQFLRNMTRSDEESSRSYFNHDQNQLTEKKEQEEKGYAHHVLFLKLLREFISGGDPSGIRQMQFPGHVTDPLLLRKMIRREFRDYQHRKSEDDDDDDNEYQPHRSISADFDPNTRRQVAFLVLRELNKKLAWAEQLEKSQSSKAGETTRHPQQAAPGVSRLPFQPASAYLRPGAYLIAHPNLKGYFRRSVICILDHKEESSEAKHSTYGTYGLIVNRLSSSPQTSKSLTLQEVLRPIPAKLGAALGSAPIREGGPVHMSLQMLHAATPDQEELKLGGHPLPMIPASEDQSTATKSDRAIYYKGNIMNAAHAIGSGRMDRDDLSFFVGACSWVYGQLESEVEQGCWLPCRGPPDIAHLGICDHEPTTGKGKPRPKADLWLSMMSACGEDEATLAHLVWADDGDNELGAACDAFIIER